eukprot:Sspe_Gene.62055::Locus_34637_Transcript_1_1_Confidence_1.000_Length_4962::g.62055::m.62055/K19511/PXDN, VPO1; peroxidase
MPEKSDLATPTAPCTMCHVPSAMCLCNWGLGHSHFPFRTRRDSSDRTPHTRPHTLSLVMGGTAAAAVLVALLTPLAGGVAPDTTKWRTYDGSGNNHNNPKLGAAGIVFPRLAEKSPPENGFALSSREMSQRLGDITRPLSNPFGVTDMHTTWGHFIAHDITLLSTGESAPFPIPTCDRSFDRDCSGDRVMPFDRTLEVNGEPVNMISSFLDGGMLYGSSAEWASALRSKGGRLETDVLGGPPLNNDQLAMGTNGLDTPRSQRKCGDVRCNITPQLLSLYTVFIREHNARVANLSRAHPQWDDDTLYHEARRWVVALMQRITYHEYLPALLGEPLPQYSGYNSSVDPSVSNEFAAAIFRYGHSEINDEVLRVDEEWDESLKGHLLLHTCFHNPQVSLDRPSGAESILRGMMLKKQRAVDLSFTDALQNRFLCKPPGPNSTSSACRDLFAIDIERNRQHRIASLNTIRKALRLAPYTSFSQITSDAKLASTLQDIYHDVDAVEFYVGMLAEDHVAGGLGETFAAGVRDQFLRLRSGDRHWHEAPGEFSAEELAQIRSSRLSAVIARNTDIIVPHTNVFFTPSTQIASKLEEEEEEVLPYLTGFPSFKVLRPGNVELYWRLLEDEVQFALHVRGSGWVGLGFDPRNPTVSLMIDVDVVIGRATDKGDVIEDRWSENIGVPSLDEARGCTSDISEATVERVSGITTMYFKRPLKAKDTRCDHDIPLGKMTIIYAYSKDSNTLAYHGANRGSAVIEMANEGEGSSVVLLVSLSVGGGALAIGVAVALGMLFFHQKKNREIKHLFNNTAIASACAEAIAEMELERLDYLQDIENPNRIQASFIRIVQLLKEYRSYLPDSLLDMLASSNVEMAAPRDDVAIVFTDCMTSLQLWANFPEEMPVCIEIMSTIFRRCASKCKGYEVKTIGESFMIAFDTPLDAVKFCLKSQEEMTDTQWPVNEALVADGKFVGPRVRMGCHAGAVITEENPLTGRADYRGTTVNKAARLTALPEDGYICLSSEVFNAISPHTDQLKGFIVDSGEHSLKGLHGNHRVYYALPNKLRARLLTSTKKQHSLGGSMTSMSFGSSQHMPLSPNDITPNHQKTPLCIAAINIITKDVQGSIGNCFQTAIDVVSTAAIASRGVLETLSDNVLVVTWNGMHPCKNHSFAGFHFLAMTRHRLRNTAVGIALGYGHHTKVGSAMKRFYTVIGAVHPAAVALSGYAAELGVAALTIDLSLKRSLDSDAARSFLRPVDVWRCNGTVHTIFEVDLRVLVAMVDAITVSLIGDIDLHEMPVSRDDTAQHDEYTETFIMATENADTAALESLGEKNTVLRKVISPSTRVLRCTWGNFLARGAFDPSVALTPLTALQWTHESIPGEL